MGVLVNVHTTARPVATASELFAPGVTGEPLSVQASAGVYSARPPVSDTKYVPVLTACAPVVSGAAPAAPVCWVFTSEPPAAVPMLSVVCPAGVPDHTFFNSIVPWLRVLVNVHTTAWPVVTETELFAPGATVWPLSVQPSDGV